MMFNRLSVFATQGANTTVKQEKCVPLCVCGTLENFVEGLFKTRDVYGQNFICVLKLTKLNYSDLPGLYEH